MIIRIFVDRHDVYDSSPTRPSRLDSLVLCGFRMTTDVQQRNLEF